MRITTRLAGVLLCLLPGPGAQAGLGGDAIVVSERFPDAADVRNPQALVVEAGGADAVVFGGQNATTVDVDPDAITLTLACGFPACNRITTSAAFSGFGLSDLDWSLPPGPPVGFEIESSGYFDPARVRRAGDQLLIDLLFHVWRDGDFIRIVPIFPPAVAIDVVPGTSRNLVTPGRPVSVAVLGSPEVDVRTIDPFSLRFGPGEATIAWSIASLLVHRFDVVDVDRDGHDDLVAQFSAAEAAIPPDATEACLSGEIDGRPYTACDSVEVRPGLR